MFMSVFAAPAIARAQDAGASGSHPVAVVRQINATELEPPMRARPEPEQVRDAAPATREHWYGWQSLSVDGASLLLLIAAGAASDSGDDEIANVMAYGALGGYLLGGPVTHFAHDNPGRGLGSLALRAGLPFAFGAIGSKLESCEGGDFCGVSGAVVGGMLGIASAIAIDAAVLGREEVPVPTPGLSSVSVDVGRDHAALVAGGTF
jgi:hypothetical protein